VPEHPGVLTLEGQAGHQVLLSDAVVLEDRTEGHRRKLTQVATY